MNRVERFRGRNPGEAMRRAREALGEDARLVRARRLSGPNDPVPAYEVSVTTAPVEETSAPDGFGVLRREIEELKLLLRERITPMGNSAPAESVAPVAASPAVETSVMPVVAASPLPAASILSVAAPIAPPIESDADDLDDAWVDRLRRRGIGRARAERLVSEALAGVGQGDVAGAVLGRVADALAAHADSRPLGMRSTVFVGPSGTGKTTTLAKVAAELLAVGERPVLVTTDGESMTGEDELARVAEAMGLRFETAFFSGQLATLAQKSPGSVLLVDTPGRTPFSNEGLSGLADIVSALDDAEVVLVIAATTDREEARAIGDGFRTLGVGRVVITKLDELCRPGRIVELAAVVGAPVARVTHGREARGAFSGASDAGVLARVLGSAGSVEAQA